MSTLTSSELKIVISTLTKRRAWLKNALEGSQLDKSVRSEHIETLKTIDSAIKKLAATTQPQNPHTLATKKATQTPSALREPKKITVTNARILIAEDNKDSASLMVELMQDIGFKLIDVAEDGISAFDKIKSSEEAFDLILCDWDMPGLTGLEVHAKAKASNTLRGAHFIMVTAISEATRIKQAIQQGVSDYIVKPVDIEVLESKIKTALNLNATPQTKGD